MAHSLSWPNKKMEKIRFGHCQVGAKCVMDIQGPEILGQNLQNLLYSSHRPN